MCSSSCATKGEADHRRLTSSVRVEERHDNLLGALRPAHRSVRPLLGAAPGATVTYQGPKRELSVDVVSVRPAVTRRLNYRWVAARSLLSARFVLPNPAARAGAAIAACARRVRCASAARPGPRVLRQAVHDRRPRRAGSVSAPAKRPAPPVRARTHRSWNPQDAVAVERREDPVALDPLPEGRGPRLMSPSTVACESNPRGKSVGGGCGYRRRRAATAAGRLGTQPLDSFTFVGPAHHLDFHEGQAKERSVSCHAYVPVTGSTPFADTRPLPATWIQCRGSPPSTGPRETAPRVERPSRSTGPLTLIAASTSPFDAVPHRGRSRLATPGSRSPTLSAHPRERIRGEARRRHLGEPLGIGCPGEEHRAARSGRQWERKRRAARCRGGRSSAPPRPRTPGDRPRGT